MGKALNTSQGAAANMHRPVEEVVCLHSASLPGSLSLQTLACVVAHQLHQDELKLNMKLLVIWLDPFGVGYGASSAEHAGA